MKKPILARTIFAASIAAVIAITAAPALAADQPVHVRGTITDVTAAGFTVQTDSGSQSIALQPDTRIAGVVPSSLDQIKPGTFIGTANVKRGGVARALEVVVFPDSMKGTGLGDYGWDLSAKGSGGSTMSGSAMTNGTVKMSQKKSASGMHSTMTNGTVKTASSGNGMTLLVDYGKGSKVITVPSNVPVVAFQPADKSALIKGAHVFVVAKPGKPLNAAVVAVGVNGTVTPM
jgi:hypothetical protein